MQERLIIVVFLRGGADGLALVPPLQDPAYFDARPTIAVPEPGQEGGALDLDGRFGLHPALAPLLPLWQARHLAIVHAVGSDDATRSHFEAQDRMERASRRADGWLARHLRTRPGPPVGALTAVAVGPSLPLALQGAPAAAIGSLADFTLLPPLAAGGALRPRAGSAGDAREVDPAYRAALEASWAAARGELGSAGRQALGALEQVREARDTPVPELPDSGFGRALADVVRLARAGVGLEIAHVDVGNWDSHFVQGPLLDGLARELAEGLAGLPAALGARWSRTTVLVLSEFGRRIYENTSLGTDHGRGGVAFVAGGAVRHEGQVLGDWPGLAPRGLDARDLPVTTDFREILAETVLWAGNADLDQVLPDWEPTGLGLFG